MTQPQESLPDVQTEAELHALIQAVTKVVGNPSFWYDFGEGSSPYLNADGCAAVAKAFHVDIGDVVELAPEPLGTADENGDPIVIYATQATFVHQTARGPHTVTTSGHYSTDAGFITSRRRVKRGKRQDGTEYTYTVLSQGEARVFARQMARARCHHTGICMVLGIPGITWDDLPFDRRDCPTPGGERRSDGGRKGGNRLSDAHRYLLDVYKGKHRANGLGPDELNAATRDVTGGFCKVTDMTPEQADAVRRKLQGKEPAPATQAPSQKAQPAAQPQADAPTPEQLRELATLSEILGLDEQGKRRYLADAGRTRGGALTRTIAASAIGAMRTEVNRRDDPGFTDDDIPF